MGHTTSAVWEIVAAEEIVPVVQAEIPQGILQNLKRVVMFGDSCSDLGSFHDAATRTNKEWAATQDKPLSAAAMAQDGPSLARHIEDGLGLLPSLPFIQPAAN